MSNLKLGKKPATADKKDFLFSELLAEQAVEIPKAPARFGHGGIFKDWGMLGNDTAGDCVFAGFAHQEMLSAKLGGHTLKFSKQSVLSDYSAVTGYVIGKDSTDQGTDVRVGLNYWRKIGILDANGNRHKIGAFVKIDHKNWEEMASAEYVFSSIGLGFLVPSTIWQQWDAGEPFDVVDEDAAIEGGHYTMGVGRAGRNTGGMITWALRKSFTKDFWLYYGDETWAIVLQSQLKKGKTERGFDLTQLNDMLSALG